MTKRIAIGCDSAATGLRDVIRETLARAGYDLLDFGVESPGDDTYYPYVAKRVAEYVQEDPDNNRGVLLCGTGIGMAIVANKFKGVRAAVGHDCFSETRSRLSNDCNILCFGSRVIGPELAGMLVRDWVSLGPVQSSSMPKVAVIHAIEQENFR